MRNLSVSMLDAIIVNHQDSDSIKLKYADFADQFNYDGVINYYFSVPRLYDECHPSIKTTHHDAHQLNRIPIQERDRNKCNLCRNHSATYRCLHPGRQAEPDRQAEPGCNFYICIPCLEINRKNDTKLDFCHLEVSTIMMCKDSCDRQTRVLGMVWLTCHSLTHSLTHSLSTD